jgi:hypothetical protein
LYENGTLNNSVGESMTVKNISEKAIVGFVYIKVEQNKYLDKFKKKKKKSRKNGV